MFRSLLFQNDDCFGLYDMPSSSCASPTISDSREDEIACRRGFRRPSAVNRPLLVTHHCTSCPHQRTSSTAPNGAGRSRSTAASTSASASTSACVSTVKSAATSAPSSCCLEPHNPHFRRGGVEQVAHDTSLADNPLIRQQCPLASPWPIHFHLRVLHGLYASSTYELDLKGFV